MSEKQYIIKLNNKRIGITYYEFADPPMGVVHGKIIFDKVQSGFAFLKGYCQKNNLKCNDIDETQKFIDTQVITDLKVYNSDGIEIKGVGNHISGMDSEHFIITSFGVPYPFYENEFPDHVKKYFGD